MAAVLRATIIGLTGTFKISGTEEEAGYLDTYSIKEPIPDETTLLLKRILELGEMTVSFNRLDNELFELLKDPDSGKLQTRLNDKAKWISKNVTELRIIDEELWRATKARQAALKITQRQDGTEEESSFRGCRR